MAKGPNKNDYKASAAENANAEVAQSEWQRFKTKYQPLLVERAKTSQTDDTKTLLRGRASADVAQAQGKPNLAVVENPTAVGDYTEASTDQLAIANATAGKRKNDVGANVLAKATQQKGTAVEGLSHAARLSVSSALTRARAKEDVAKAKLEAAAQIGSSLVTQGARNYGQTGDIWTPGRIDPKATSENNGVPVYNKAKDFQDRVSIGMSTNAGAF